MDGLDEAGHRAEQQLGGVGRRLLRHQSRERGFLLGIDAGLGVDAAMGVLHGVSDAMLAVEPLAAWDVVLQLVLAAIVGRAVHRAFAVPMDASTTRLLPSSP